jgi:hypothetical protein
LGAKVTIEMKKQIKLAEDAIEEYNRLKNKNE